jgi:predicted RNA-binding Zn ribbon-like protein
MKPVRPIGSVPSLTLAIANSAMPRRPARARAREVDDPFRDRLALVRFARNWLQLGSPTVAKNDLVRLVRWRDALSTFLAAFATGNPSTSALAILNEEIERATRTSHVSAKLEVEAVASDGLVERLVANCIDEIAGCDPVRIRQCSRPECSLLFYYTTRNHSARFHAENPCGWRAREARRRQSARGKQSPPLGGT